MLNSQKIAATLLAASLLSLTGCIERKVTIATDPAGALITLNDDEIGRAPITVPILWNGDYDVVARLDRNVGTAEKPIVKHYFLHSHHKTKIQPYEIFGIDFFAEVAPWPIVHQEVWAFQVPVVDDVPDDILILRAQQLKHDLDTPEDLKKHK